jgi:hypothetical protein
MEMKNKLLIPFPLLSDARGELAKKYGLWNEEGVASPSIVVIDQSGEIQYLYAGSDFADRPGDEEIYAALDGLKKKDKPGLEGPEIRLSGIEAQNGSVRPDRPPITLEQLIPYYRGVYFTTLAFKKRFGEWGRAGKNAFREVGKYQTLTSGYSKALQATKKLKSS